MKVLTAGVGTLAEDFAYTVPGEIVFLGPVCGRDEDGSCGCGRSFTGLSSRLATTIAVVVENELMTVKMLTVAVRDSMLRAGMRYTREAGGEMAEEIAQIASLFDAGTRLRRIPATDEVVPT